MDNPVLAAYLASGGNDVGLQTPVQSMDSQQAPLQRFAASMQSAIPPRPVPTMPYGRKPFVLGSVERPDLARAPLMRQRPLVNAVRNTMRQPMNSLGLGFGGIGDFEARQGVGVPMGGPSMGGLDDFERRQGIGVPIGGFRSGDGGTDMRPAPTMLRDGGRVKMKRAPVTIEAEPRYASGGRAGGLPFDQYAQAMGGSPDWDQATWDSMPPERQYQLFMNVINDPQYTGNGDTPLRLGANPDAEAIAAYQQRFGGDGSNLAMGYGDGPALYGSGAREFATDPSQILRLPDGRWVMRNDNVNGDWLARQQAMDNNSGVTRQLPYIAGAIFGAGAAGAFGAAGAGVDAAGAPIAAGTAVDESAGLSMANPFTGTTGAPGTAAIPPDLPLSTGAGEGGTPLVDQPSIYHAGDVGLQPGMVDVPGDLPLNPGTVHPDLGEIPNITQADPTLAGTPNVRGGLNNPLSWDRFARLGSSATSLFTGSGRGGGADYTPLPYETGPGLQPEGGSNPLARNGGTAPAAPTSGSGNPALDAYLAANSANSNGAGVSTGGGGFSVQGASASPTPIEQLIMDNALKTGSAGEQEAAAGKAAAEVAQRFNSAKHAERNRLIAQGINPDDARGAGAELARLSALDEAKASVGASNIARQQEKDQAFDKQVKAANISNQVAERDYQNRQLAQQAGLQMAAINSRSSDSAAERAARLQEEGLDRAWRTGENVADRGFRSSQNNADRTWRSGESVLDRNLTRDRINSDNSYRSQQAARQNQIDRGRGVGSIITGARDIYGLGRDFGWFADGGRVDALELAGLETAWPVEVPGNGRRLNYRDGARVRGPGSKTSDSIRARLSDGEHVINAEGVELMDATNPGALDAINGAGMKIRAVRKRLAVGLQSAGLGD